MAVAVERRPGLVVIVFSGDVSVDDLVDLAHELDAIDAVTPGLPRFADTTPATGARFTFEDVARLTEDRRSGRRPESVQIAILARSDVAFGLARMYQSMLGHPQITMEVFRDRAAAMAWLGVEPDLSGAG
jgi:hypothetical protein